MAQKKKTVSFEYLKTLQVTNVSSNHSYGIKTTINEHRKKNSIKTKSINTIIHKTNKYKTAINSQINKNHKKIA